MSLTGIEALFGGAAGPGKALSVATPIATPEGWRTMGELNPGDEVFGADGKPTEIVACSDVMRGRKCYRIEFSDGTHFVADAEHSWKTFTADDLTALTRRDESWKAGRRAKRASRVSGNKSGKFTASLIARNKAMRKPGYEVPSGGLVTTEQIAQTLTKRGRRNHAVSTGGSIQCSEKDLPLDPYVLGAWLGDGTSSGAGFTSADEAIVSEIRKAGWLVDKAASAYGWKIGETQRKERRGRGLGLVNSFSTLLRQLGLLDNKHVPAIYLRGSEYQRLALLQGLMDTDGHANEDGSVEFTNTNRQLADAVQSLACSLAYKAHLNEGRAMLYGKDCGPKFRVNWMADKPMFRLPRKLERQKREWFRRTIRFRFIVACEPCESVPVKCIQVAAGDGMFLAGRTFVPTHNSSALLMAALQFVEVPNYSALLLRKSFSDLNQPGALIPRSMSWLGGTDARWSGAEHAWHFPSGAILKFGYLDAALDIYQFASAEFQFIGYDELTQFQEFAYRFLFSRLRRPKDMNVPLRCRSASNPGGVGHEWVKRRFITEGRREGRIFVPATLSDNPHIDRESYVKMMDNLDPVTRRQLLEGDWTARQAGSMFRREWFKIVDAAPASSRIVRYWDMAASEPSKKGRDPDWTAGPKVSFHEGNWYLQDMRRFRGLPAVNEANLKQTAQMDGFEIPIRMEQEPGASGKSQVDHYARTILPGYAFAGIPSLADKITRAGPFSSAAEGGRFFLVNGPWISDFLDEVESFPDGAHDDQIDGVTGAMGFLSTERKIFVA